MREFLHRIVEKRIHCAAICVILLCFAAAVFAAPEPPAINATSAILIDAVSGKVLYEKNCHARRPPASTTKMMTAILALENGKLDGTVCASEYASSTRFGSLHLKPGEQLTMRDLLYGMLLRSANDAAVCAAENVAGSEAKFVEMMNLKAAEIGLKDTHFKNPHGLYTPGHYSTAYDLAQIARYAICIPEFNEMVRTRNTRIARSISTLDVTLKNTANFLEKYDGADGIKTGYTKEAGHCFVGSATRDGWRIISVVLKDDKAGQDTIALMDYGFKYYKQVLFAQKNQVVAPAVPVRGGVADKIDLVADKGLDVILKKGEQADSDVKTEIYRVAAPVHKGEKLGTLTGYLNGEEVGTVNLVAAETVDRSLSATAWAWTRSVLSISGIFILGFVSYGTAVAKTARRRRRRIPSRGGKADNLRARSRQW